MARPSLIAALVLAWAVPSHAEPNEEAIRFQYTAPPECPDAESFTARVRQRTPRGRLANEAELARTFSVELSADAQGFLGAIEFLDDGGTKVSRRVHGEQCDAVVSSLALITALALDATLRDDETEELPPAPEKKPPRVVLSAPEEAPKAAPPPHAAARRSLTGARIGVRGGYHGAVHAAEVALLGQLDWRNGVALRLSAHYAWNDFSVDTGRSARLQLLGLAPSVCPWRIAWKELAIAPCAQLDLGTLRVAGVRSPVLTSADHKTILWAAVGAELRLAWEPAAPFWVELQGTLEFPLVASYRFIFKNPEKDAYKVPYAAGSGALVVGVRFW